MSPIVLLIVLLPFLGALAVAGLERATVSSGRPGLGRGVALATLALALLLLLGLAPWVLAGGRPGFRSDWLPAAGLALSFALDGPGLLVAAFALAAGLRGLARAAPAGPLLILVGGVTGMALSANILILLTFLQVAVIAALWRAPPRPAEPVLIRAGAGAVLLMAGGILLGRAAGSPELAQIARGDPLALALVLAGLLAGLAPWPTRRPGRHEAVWAAATVLLLTRLWPLLAAAGAPAIGGGLGLGLLALAALATGPRRLRLRPVRPAPLAVGGLAAAALLAGLAAFASGTVAPGERTELPVRGLIATSWLVLVAGCLALTGWRGRREVACLAATLPGLVIALWFAVLSAPDLALLQLTISLAVLPLLAAFPAPPAGPGPGWRALAALRPARPGLGLLCAAAGLGLGLLAYGLMIRNPALAARAPDLFAAVPPTEAGRNMVHAILAFRGLDGWAAAAALVAAALATRAGGVTPRAAPPPVLLAEVTLRVIVLPALMVAGWLLLRGPEAPGGPWAAGLLAAVALGLPAGVGLGAPAGPDPRLVMAAGLLLAAGGWVTAGPVADLGLALAAAGAVLAIRVGERR